MSECWEPITHIHNSKVHKSLYLDILLKLFVCVSCCAVVIQHSVIIVCVCFELCCYDSLFIYYLLCILCISSFYVLLFFVLLNKFHLYIIFYFKFIPLIFICSYSFFCKFLLVNYLVLSNLLVMLLLNFYFHVCIY